MSFISQTEWLRHSSKGLNSRLRMFAVSDRAFAITYLAVMSAVYFPIACYFATVRAFWFDEIVTYYVAALPDARSVWNALLGGMDIHPPLDYLIRHFSMALCGRSQLADRLPSIVGFYISFVCVFVLGRRIHSTLSGVLASSLLLTSPAGPYAVEGRPYSLLVACASVSILVWHRLCADEKAPRWIWATLGLCLASAVWLHYYGVVLIMAFAIAGAVEWIARFRMPRQLMATIALASAAIIPVVGFARNGRQYAATFWTQPARHPLRAIGDAVNEFDSAAGLIMAVLLCVFVGGHLPRLPWFSWRARRRAMLPTPMVVLVAVLMLAPVLVWLLAITVTHAYVPRYAITGIAAASVAAGWALAKACGRNTALAIVVSGLCVLAAPAALKRLSVHESRKELAERVAGLDRQVEMSPLPIVFADPLRYLEAYHYGTERVRRNLVALSDGAASRRILGSDSTERSMSNFRRYVPIRFEPFDQFVANYPRFRLFMDFGGKGPVPWAFVHLREVGYRLSLPPGTSDSHMYECER